MAHEVEVGMVLIRFDDLSLLSMAHEVEVGMVLIRY